VRSQRYFSHHLDNSANAPSPRRVARTVGGRAVHDRLENPSPPLLTETQLRFLKIKQLTVVIIKKNNAGIKSRSE
jgi:hypothetical protein